MFPPAVRPFTRDPITSPMSRGFRISAVPLLLLAACDGALTAPNVRPAEPVLARIACEADVRSAHVTCSSAGVAGTSASRVILGGQGVYVRLLDSPATWDAGTQVFSLPVAVENLTVWPMGTPDSLTATGVRVFFASGPSATTVTSGDPSAYAVYPLNDSTGMFTSGSQSYYPYPGILAAGDTTGEQTWEFHVDAGVQTFSFTVYVAAQLPAETGILRFQSFPGAPTASNGNFIQDVWARDGHVFAVGEGGRIRHFDGTTWRDTVPVSVQELYAVHGSSIDNVYAVGMQGLILRWDGSVWVRDIVADGGGAVDTQTLYSVFVLDADHVYAAGEGRIYQKVNGTWSRQQDVLVNDAVHSILARSATEVYAAGTSFTYFSDGSSWTRSYMGEGGQQIIVRGDSVLKVVEHTESSTVYDRAPLGSSSNWTPRSTSPVALKELWVADAANVYGVGNNGTLVHWNGGKDTDGTARWTVLRSGTSEWLGSISGEGREFVAAGASALFQGLR